MPWSPHRRCAPGDRRRVSPGAANRQAGHSRAPPCRCGALRCCRPLTELGVVDTAGVEARGGWRGQFGGAPRRVSGQAGLRARPTPARPRSRFAVYEGALRAGARLRCRLQGRRDRLALLSAPSRTSTRCPYRPERKGPGWPSSLCTHAAEATHTTSKTPRGRRRHRPQLLGQSQLDEPHAVAATTRAAARGPGRRLARKTQPFDSRIARRNRHSTRRSGRPRKLLKTRPLTDGSATGRERVGFRCNFDDFRRIPPPRPRS
jgi:hypothetical protein